MKKDMTERIVKEDAGIIFIVDFIGDIGFKYLGLFKLIKLKYL